VGSKLDLAMFDEPAVLRLYKGSKLKQARRGSLGPLLNRVRRMRSRKAMTTEIVCGKVVFTATEIDDLIASPQYRTWLTLPLSQRSVDRSLQ
jgi:hypothetical protein